MTDGKSPRCAVTWCEQKHTEDDRILKHSATVAEIVIADVLTSVVLVWNERLDDWSSLLPFVALRQLTPDGPRDQIDLTPQQAILLSGVVALTGSGSWLSEALARAGAVLANDDEDEGAQR